MNREKLAAAVAEAERFIARAKALPAPVERQYYHGGGSYFDDGFPPKHGGAIRRASMDLTRSLSDLRKSKA